MARAFRGLIHRVSATSWLAFAVLLAGLSFSPKAAAVDYPTYAAAMAACQYSVSTGQVPTSGSMTCVNVAVAGAGYCSVDQVWTANDQHIIQSGYPCGTAGNNPCEIAPTKSWSEGKLLQGYSTCSQIKDPASGAILRCALTVSAIGRPVQNAYNGSWQTYSVISSSGNQCGSDQTDGYKDNAGHPIVPSPPAPTLPVVPAISSPSSCGEGSCYNPQSDTGCAMVGGSQVCVTGANMRSSAGSCTNSGNSSVCGGSPTAKKPSNPPITDPPTQVENVDTYKTADPITGVVNTATIITYSGTPGSTSSGQSGADSGPGAPAGKDDKGDETSASGGEICTAPPVCEGAAATCMVAHQAWLLRCASDLGGSSNDGDTAVPGLDDIGTTPGEAFHRTETLLDKLDTGGLGGGGQCPNLIVLDLEQYGVHLDGNNPMWCSILEKAGYMLMFLAAFISLRILSEK